MKIFWRFRFGFCNFPPCKCCGPKKCYDRPIFYQRLKDGKQCFVTKSRRDFVFVKDLARVVLKACDGCNGAYHFSSGSDVAIEDLYNAVVKAMDLPQYPHPVIKELGEDDVVSILLDPSRLSRFWKD